MCRIGIASFIFKPIPVWSLNEMQIGCEILKRNLISSYQKYGRRHHRDPEQ